MDSFTRDEWRDGTVLARLAKIDDGEPETRAALEFCRTMRANWGFTPVQIRRAASEVVVVGADEGAQRHVSRVRFTRTTTYVHVADASARTKEYVCPHANGSVHPCVYALCGQSYASNKSIS